MLNQPTTSQLLADNGGKSNRRKSYKLHTWVGFHLAFIMAIILATGTIATLSYEIDWVIYKEMRVTPGDKKVSWQTMTDAIEEYAPESHIISLTALEGDYLAYRANVIDNYNRRYFIHVNQWTGEVSGETGVVTVQRVFRDLHRYLFMHNIIGLPIVSSMAFILLISLYTGLKTSRNWRTLMTRVRFNKGSRILIGDAHKAAGLWSIWFIVLIAVTGIWYLAEFTGLIADYASKSDQYSFQTSRAKLSTERLKSIGSVIDKPTTDEVIQVAHKAFPKLKNNITQIFFPLSPDRTIRVLGQPSYPILRSRANQVYIDPESLEVVKVQRSEEISWVAWLNNTADPLHFGTFGGLITKVIWFIFGLALSGLSITGVVLTWKRLKTKSVSSMQLKTLPVLFISLLSCYFYWYPLFQAPESSYSELNFVQETNIGFNIELRLGVNDKKAFDGKISLLAKARDGYANIKYVFVSLNKNNESLVSEKQLKLRLFSKTSIYKSKLPIELLNQSDRITVSIKLNTGEVINNNWYLKLTQ